MTTPRSMKINLNVTPYYHCITRCVRRAYLNGKDPISHRDYSHRKLWLVQRFKELASIFSIQICAYAVMSNHYHLVLYVDDDQSLRWSRNEVIERWSQLFPKDAAKIETAFLSEQDVENKIALWRMRLSDISWFMRCLNENIARRSNAEDECNGRFWEGRFKSQALLDEAGLLAAMVYVDLNPIRAKQASTPEESEFTSIYERIKAIKLGKFVQPNQLMPFKIQGGNIIEQNQIDFNLFDYFQLVDETGRYVRMDKKGAIPDNLKSILSRLNLNSHGWFDLIKDLGQSFAYAIGEPTLLSEFGPITRARGRKGIVLAKKCYFTVK